MICVIYDWQVSNCEDAAHATAAHALLAGQAFRDSFVSAPAIEVESSDSAVSLFEQHSPVAGDESPHHLAAKTAWLKKQRDEVVAGEDEWLAELISQSELNTRSTRDEVLAGEDEWLAELISQSELNTRSTRDEVLAGEDEWLAELMSRSEVNRPTRDEVLAGEDEWLAELLAGSEIATPAAVASAVATTALAPSTTTTSSLPTEKTRAFKWGQCQGLDSERQRCNLSRMPWIFRSGQKQGHLVLVCRGFLKQLPDGRRRCWCHAPFPMERFSELPEGMRQDYQDIRNVFRRTAV